MLDDAKDKILNEFGYDLQPDGTLKLDQIMDILRLANETVSGSMAVQEKEVGKDGLSKIDQLKGLIKGLSEKVGLSSPEVSETDHKTEGTLDGSMAFEKVNDLGEVPDEIAGGGEVEGGLKEVEEIDELEEDEVLEGVDDLADVLDEISEEDEIEENLDEIEDLEEDEIIEEVEDVDLDELTEGPEDSERAGGQDHMKGTGIDSGVDTSGSEEGPDGVGASEKDAGMGSQSEDAGDGHVAVGDGVGSEGGLGPDPLIGDELPEGMEIDDSQEIEEIEDLEEDEVLEAVDDLEDVSDEIAGGGEVEGGLKEVEEIDELEEDEVLEGVDDLADVLDEISEEDEIEENLDEIEDLEEDEIIEEVEDVDLDELTEGPEDSERAGGQDHMKGTGIDSGVDTSGSEEGPDGVGASEKDAGMGSQSEDAGDGHVAVGDGVGSEGGLGPDPLIGDELPEGMEIDDSQEIEEIEDLEEDEVLEAVDDLEDVSDEIAGGGEVEGGLKEVEEIDELEEDEVLEGVDDLADVLDEISEQDEIEENLDEIEDLEEDEIIEEVEDVDIDDTVDETGFDGAPGGVGENFDEDYGKDGIKKAEDEKETEEIGLPVDSLGKEYSNELSDKVKKDSLLAEEFDGYLGVMDRYYNHYILIPGGEYIVGSKKPGKDEKSEQLISLSPFYIGRFPVTNGLFEIFVEKTGYKTVAEKVGYGKVYYGRFQRKKDETTGLMISTWNSSLYCETVEGACWYQPCGPGSTLHNKRNHPVVQISFQDAVAFAAWTGKRLPTENEWEAASRTAKGWIFPWGKEWKKHSCNIENSCTGDTTPVEKYAEFENDFGIADTIGNILEWTFDDVTALSDNKNKYRYHIAKGGSWISGDDIRLFSRFKIEPESHSNILGFRCVAH